jgi:hypothetical protein
MRLSSRLLAALLLGAGVASCSDTKTINTPIPPGKHAGKIGLAPEFSPAARSVAAALGDFGLTYDHVRVTIRNNPDTNSIVADTTVDFAPSSQNLTLDLTVPVDVDGQIFNALLQYIGPSGTVFAGSILVQSHAPDQPAPEQQTLVLNFVGPGAKLKTITISPKPVTLVGSATVPVTLAATDSSGASIAVPPLVFNSTDSSVAVLGGTTTNRVVQSFGKRGEVLLTATTPIGISDTLSAFVTLPAASVVLVSGGGQSGTVGTALTNPAVVQVNASDGIGVAGVTVTFAPPIGGSVGTTTAGTDLNGRASTTLTLATAAGPQSFVASVTGITPVAIPATAVAGAASATTSTITSNVTSINADDASPATITVQAKDQYGNPLTTGGATVTLTTSLGHWGARSSATTVTATDVGNGTYSATLYSSQSGTATITGTVGGTAIATPAVTVTAVASLVTHFEIVRANGSSLAPSVPAGTPIAVRITALDASNSVVTGYTGPTKIRVVGSTFVGDSVVVAAAVAGVTNVNLTFGQPNTNVDITATGTVAAGELTTASVAFEVLSGPAANLVAIGSGPVVVNDFDTTPSNYPIVQVTDGAGNPIQGATVSFALRPQVAGSPPCGLTISASTTDVEGTITFDGRSLQWPSGNGPSSCVLIATANGPSGAPLSGSPLYIALVVQPNGGTTWTGAVTTDWTDKGNWTHGPPSASSQVFIPMATSSALGRNVPPTLPAATTLASIEVEDAGLLLLNNQTLTIDGGEVNGHTIGTISGGTLSLMGGDGAGISGRMPDVVCPVGSNGYRQLSGVVQANSVTLNQCQLELNGQVLQVVKDFTTADQGLLAMSSSESGLIVFGKTTFAGASESGFLVAGTIVANGDFAQVGTGANGYTFATGNNVNIGSGGATNQTISFDDPTNSSFQTVTINLVTGKTVTLSTPVRIASRLDINGVTAGGTLALPQGLANTTNGPISVFGTAMTITLGGIINASSLTFDAGSSVTLLGDVTSLALPNGIIEFKQGARVIINAGGTLDPAKPPAAGCTVEPNVVIEGTNSNAVAVLTQFCRPVTP